MTSSEVLDKNLVLMIAEGVKMNPDKVANQYKPIELMKLTHSYSFALRAVEEFSKMEVDRVTESLVAVLLLILDKIPEDILKELLGEDYDNFINTIQNA